MNWKDVLIKKGFTYDTINEYYKKSMGFGRIITVDQIVKGLFRITRNNTILYDNYPSSFKEFKDIVNKTLG